MSKKCFHGREKDCMWCEIIHRQALGINNFKWPDPDGVLPTIREYLWDIISKFRSVSYKDEQKAAEMKTALEAWATTEGAMNDAVEG